MSGNNESHDQYPYLNYVIGDPIAQSDHETGKLSDYMSKEAKKGCLIVIVGWLAIAVLFAVLGITR